MKKALIIILSIVVGLAIAAGAVILLLPDGEEPHTHQYEKTTVREATCESEGELLYECKCGDTYTEKISVLGHTYGTCIDEVPATCEAEGIIGHYNCSVCGKNFDTNKVEVDSLVIVATDHIYGEWTQTLAPGCESKGTECRDCDNCDHYETRDVNAAGHTYGTWIDEVSATCEGEGTLGHYNCSVCGKNFDTNKVEVDSLVIAATGHAYSEWTQTLAPGCESKGTERRDCGNCDHYETRDVDATGHAYGEWTQISAPGCESKGTERRDCDNCDHYETRDVDATGHNYGEWNVTTDPTESTTGLLTKTCSNDATHKETFTLPKLSTSNGYTYAVVTAAKCESTGVGRYTYIKDGQTLNFDITLEELGHNYGSWDVTTEPTEGTTGVLTKTCSNDASHKETFTLPKLSTENGYAYSVVTEAKCESTGVGRYTYTKDGQTFNFDVTLNELGHDYGSWSVTTEPTKGTTGVLTKTCSNDASHKETFTLPKLSTENGYTYSVVTAAKCESTGIDRYTYTKDGQAFSFDVTLDELGHDYSSWSVTTEPTESATGVLTSTCSNDATHKETFILPKLSTSNGYTYSVATAAKCESTGVGRYTYTKDGQNFSFDIMLEELGHNYGEWSVTTDPTESATGVLTKTCSNDATHKETFTLPKVSTSNGYTYAVVTAAKCESTGVGRYTYTKDGQTFNFDVTLEELGHSYGEWSVTTDPTEGTTGALTKTCSNDASHKEIFTLPKLNTENGYTYSVVTVAKCESTGIGRYTYTKDGQTFNFDVTLEELGHSYGEWNVTTEPTESATGVLIRTCSNDANHKETFALPKLSTSNGYTYAVVTAAKCESTGIGRYTYTKDGQNFSFDIMLEELGHNYGEWSVTTDPAESATGLLTKTCSNDAAHKETFTLPKLSAENGYTYSVVTPAKCESTGIGRYTYTKDGQTFNFDVTLEELGHSYGEWRVVTNPTTTNEGMLEAVCHTDASHIDTFVLPKLSTTNGYTYEIITAATNTTDGLGRYTYIKGTQTFTFDVVIAANETEFDPR